MMYKECLCVVIVVFGLGVTAQAMVLPKDVKRLMATVHNLESFMKAFNISNITIIGDRPAITAFDSDVEVKHSSHGMVPDLFPGAGSSLNKRPAVDIMPIKHVKSPKKKLINRVFLGRSRVVSFSDTSTMPMLLEDARCKPYLTVVEVPQPGHGKGINYPFNVQLHRCAGSCHIKPKIQSCEPTETKEINLLAFVVSWSSSSDKSGDLHRSARLIKMLNHTKCGCKCIAKPSQCNPAIQQFSEELCRCECKVKSPRCPAYHTWDPIGCKCVCNPPRDVYCPRKFEWSPQKCSCVCKNTKCRANKVRNYRNCRCYCSKNLPPCGQGLVRSRRDCKCI